MGEFSRIVCCVVACVLCVCTLVLTTVAIPMDAFKGREEADECFSFWGRKSCGTNTDYNTTVAMKGFLCNSVKKKMTAGGACGIAGAALSLIALAFHIAQLFKVCAPWTGVTGICIGFLVFVMTLVAWVQIVSSRDTKCPDPADAEETLKMSANYKLGVAFALLLVAWILQTINFVFIGCGW